MSNTDELESGSEPEPEKEKPITGRYPELAKEMRRLLRGMSSRAAARKSGVNYATLSTMLHGDRASMESTVKVAQAFGADPNRLLEVSGYPVVHAPAPVEDPLLLAGREVDPTPLAVIPLAPGKVSANPNRARDTVIEPYGTFGERLPGQVRSIEVEGDCMQPFFQDGDVLFVRESEDARNGDKVIALIDYDSITCKTFRRGGSGKGEPYLEASNGHGSGHAKRIEADRFRILGIVVGFYRRLR